MTKVHGDPGVDRKADMLRRRDDITQMANEIVYGVGDQSPKLQALDRIRLAMQAELRPCSA
jgi:hypothetical protein